MAVQLAYGKADPVYIIDPATGEPLNPEDIGDGAGLGAQYNVTLPTYNDGDPTRLQSDGRGNLRVSLVNPADQSLVQYLAGGHVFDVAVAPTVTNGGYSGGDIQGGLLTFEDVAPGVDLGFCIGGVQVICKADVLLNAHVLHLFNADPTNTTKTDNSAYSLAAADAFKLIKTFDFAKLGVVNHDHGTPRSISIDNLAIWAKPASGTRDIYGLLVDGTGLTLTSTSDIQVRVRGPGG